MTEHKPTRSSGHARRWVSTAGVILAATAGLLTSSTHAVAGSARAQSSSVSTAGPDALNACTGLPAVEGVRVPQRPCPGHAPRMTGAGTSPARAAVNSGSAGVAYPRPCPVGLTPPIACPQSPATSDKSAPYGQGQPTSAQAVSGWSIVTSANTSTTQSNLLYAATCVSASDCWAVGYGYSSAGNAAQTLIEHWDGTSWVIVTSPNASVTQNELLYAVTCVSASDCWAVGYYSTGSAVLTLIERWDGTSWAIVTSPNNTSSLNFLEGVTCTMASDCWAAGIFVSNHVYQTLIERWDGTAWVIVTSPNTASPTGGAQPSLLQAVTCVSASDCWAVGYYGANLAATVCELCEQTLVEHWDGTAWVIVTSDNALPPQNNVLIAVTCVSRSDCWADGYKQGNLPGQTLIEHWDGAAWTVVTSPNANLPTQGESLYGVACASATECWAVGYYSGSINPQTLIEQWDGTAWTIVTSPDSTSTQANILHGVTCASASECWAVGEVWPESVSQTLIEEYLTTPPAQIPDSPWAPFLPVAGVAILATRQFASRHKRRGS